MTVLVVMIIGQNSLMRSDGMCIIGLKSFAYEHFFLVKYVLVDPLVHFRFQYYSHDKLRSLPEHFPHGNVSVSSLAIRIR